MWAKFFHADWAGSYLSSPSMEMLGTGYSLLLLHLGSHAQQLSDRARGQTLHLVVQLRHGVEKSCHGGEAFAGKIGARFFRIQLLQTSAQHLAGGIDFAALAVLDHQPEHLPNVFHRLIMFPPVAEHMHRPHDPPTLELADRGAHV